ncbi:hypothetical protein BOX15_Mlig004827g1 [Macrostomum lignano]|uniref:Uncharacterized protein n=1 Tax=Macrostomum lignano TaxID=282301 RepID=A0A267H654_9PLAT|nr:hypothetical protein BOX15_Mlig004827g1 [Macrostomum lignano]
MDHVAKVTAGLRLPLAEIRGVCDFLMAIAYRECSSDALQDIYEHEVRTRDGPALPGDVSRMLGLVKRASATSAAGSTKAAATVSSATKTIKAKMAKVATKRTPVKAKKTTKITAVATKSINPRTKSVKTCSTKKLPTSTASISWSPWRLVGQPGRVNGLSWQQFGSGSVRQFLTRSSGGGQRAVELAVQPRPGARRFPLFGRVLSLKAGSRLRHGLSAVTFGRLLSGRPTVRAQLLRVLSQGMRVFARISSAEATGADPKLLPRLVKAASYAWNSGRSTRCAGVFVSVSERSLC